MGGFWEFLVGRGADGATAGLAVAAKAAGVLAVAALVARGLRGRSAATRHLVWCLGLLGALAVPPLSLALPRWGVAILAGPADAVVVPGSVDRGDLGHSASAPVGPNRVTPPTQTAATPVAPSPPTTAPTTVARLGPGGWCLAVWGLGSLAVLGWYAIGWGTVWRLGRRAARIGDPAWLEVAEEAAGRLGVGGRVVLVRGGPGAMPLTWGLVRPMVLVPAGADAWPRDRRRTVLLHELAHVRRRDCLTQGLGMAACAAYWFNPLAWWAAARLRAERELACDDLVLAAGERPSDYAAQLLGVARSLRPAPARLHSALAMARPSGLEHRLVAILAPNRARRGPARWLAIAGLGVALAASATLAAAWPVSPTPAGRVVTGRIVGADGQPLGGAAVVLLTARPGGVGTSDAPDPSPLGRATSDATGAFRIEVADDRARPDDDALLVATAPGRGFAARRLTDLNAPLAEALSLAAEQPITVRLVDLQGAPIAGAVVRLGHAYAYPGEGLNHHDLNERLLPDLATPVVADAVGRCTLRGLGPNASISLEIQAPGFGQQSHELLIKDAGPETTIALARAQVIAGRVTLGPDGPPAPGARVRAQSMSMSEGVGMTRGEAEATTDATGQYRIEIAPGASVRIVVDPPSVGADSYLLRGRLIVPTESVVAREDFALPRGVLVRGRVTDQATGQPIAGAIVHHEDYERNNPYYIAGTASFLNGDEQMARTDANGAYHLAVMPGPGYLVVRGPTDDYLHQEVSQIELSGELIWPNTRHYPDALRKLDLKPDAEPLTVDLSLRRGVTVGGRVLTPEGQPVREAIVFSRWLVSPTLTVNFGQRVLPVRGGRFTLAGCNPDASAPAYFLDPARQLGAMVPISGQQVGRDLNVTLQPCGSASLRFVDKGGKPLPAGPSPGHLEIALSSGASFADIFMGNDDPVRTSPLMADAVHVANLDRDRYRNLQLDPAGRLLLPTLIPNATYRVVVYNQPVKTQVEFTVQAGETKDLGDLAVPQPDRAR